MRLARVRTQSTRDSLLVAVVPPPALPTQFDLEQLFCDAYNRLHGRLLDHAERFLDRESARDAVSEAIADLWVRWAYLTPAQRTDKYFFGAVHHIVLDARRAAHERVSLEDAGEEIDQQAVLAIETPTAIDTAADVLDLALAVMPPRRREVFLLIREEFLSYKEAAETLGLRVGTINRHYRLATADLRAAFTQAGFRITTSQRARLSSPKGDATND